MNAAAKHPYVSAALSFAIGSIVLLSGPALVELRWATTPTPLRAVRELWTKPPVLSSPEGQLEFISDNNAAGVLAYWLSYYGIRESPANLEPLLTGANVSQIQTVLNQRFGIELRPVPVTRESPSLPGIVRLRNGRWALYQANLRGRNLLDPSRGSVVKLSRSEPAPIDDLVAWIPSTLNLY